MDHIRQALNKRIKQSGIATQITTALIIEDFKRLVKEELGENASKKIKPLYIKNRVLIVACISSVISQEINFHKEQLITEINRRNGLNAIENIRFIL